MTWWQYLLIVWFFFGFGVFALIATVIAARDWAWRRRQRRRYYG